MDEIVNKSLLAGDKFMPKMHLRQPRFTYSACRPFTKDKERIQKFKETGDWRCIYQNKLDKVCFQLDMTYADFKYLPSKTASDKELLDKSFNIAKKPKYDGYRKGLALMVYKCFHEKTPGVAVKSETVQNKELAEELHKPLVRNFENRKIYSSFKDNICFDDLAHMQLMSKFNKGFRFSLCVIEICSKFVWVVLLKIKKSITTTLLRLFKKKY